MDLSIVIVNWNTRDILRDCLKSVFEQTEGITFEVIVVDNASVDGSAAMVKGDFPKVTLVENGDNRGFSAANNQGMRVAKGRYLLLLNSDTVVLDNAIAKAVQFADRHKDSAVVGCRVLNADRTLQPTCFMFPSVLNLALSATYLYKMFPLSRFLGRERMTWWGRDDIREVEVVTGCFMLVRKGAIEQVGVMDERFFMYAEETDWCWRFREAGWRNVFFPGAEIIHLGGQSTRQVKPQMVLQLRAGILQFMRKHGGFTRYCIACVLVSVWFGARILPWTLIAVLCTVQRKKACLMVRTYASGAGKSLRGWKALSAKA